MVDASSTCGVHRRPRYGTSMPVSRGRPPHQKWNGSEIKTVQQASPILEAGRFLEVSHLCLRYPTIGEAGRGAGAAVPVIPPSWPGRPIAALTSVCRADRPSHETKSGAPIKWDATLKRWGASRPPPRDAAGASGSGRSVSFPGRPPKARHQRIIYQRHQRQDDEDPSTW